MKVVNPRAFVSRGLGSAILLFVGLLFTAYLVWHAGAPAVFAILRASSLLVLLLLPVHVFVIGLDVMSWRLLLIDVSRRPRFSRLTWLALLREAVNGLLPVARVGGELLGIRLLARMGVSIYQAAASVVVEVSLTLISQFLFVLLGVVLLLCWAGAVHLLIEVLYALFAVVPVLVLFFWLQGRVGLFSLIQKLLRRLSGGRDFLALLGDPLRLDAEIAQLYKRRLTLLWANVWQLSSLFAGAGELWLSFVLLRHPISGPAAFLLESLGQALRSMVFFMPAAVGVQEGGFILFGAAVGVGPDLALAYSLLRRFRELALGLPLLLFWYVLEGKQIHHIWLRNRCLGDESV